VANSLSLLEDYVVAFDTHMLGMQQAAMIVNDGRDLVRCAQLAPVVLQQLIAAV
jgi:hypothetical protein